MKPCAAACGRGVKMITKKTKIHKSQKYLISEYINQPHLINWLKYDLRCYVLVASFDPLRIYLYEEGLTRFATEKYSTTTSDLSKRYVHLTNYAVNKKAPNYLKNDNKNNDGIGSKWSFKALK